MNDPAARAASLPARVRQLVSRARQIGLIDLSASMGVVVLLGFVQKLLVARLLGPEGLGHVSIVNAVMSLGTLLAGAGLTTAILRHSAAQSEDADAWGVFATGMRFAGVLSVLVATGLAAFTFTPLWVFDPIAGRWLPLAAVALPFLTITSCSIAYLQSRGRMRDKAVLGLLLRLFSLVGIVVGVIQLGFPGYVWGYVAGALAVAAVATWRVRSFRPRRRRTSPVPVREVVRFGFWSLFTQLLNYVLLTADVLCVSALTGNAALVGLYGLSTVLQSIAKIPVTAYMDAIFPRLTRQAADVETLRRVRSVLRGRTVALSAASAGVVALGAPWLVPAAFGAEYAGSLPPLYILLAGQVVRAFGAPAGRSLIAAGWVEGNFWSGVVAATINIAANLLLIPEYGIAGAALATALTHGVWSILVTILASRLDRRRLSASESPIEFGSDGEDL